MDKTCATVIGKDYAVYLLGAMQRLMRKGMDAGSAFRETLRTTGKAVFFTAAALSVGTGVWIVSGLQLQADMGILLAFTFIANLLAVLILFPALARVLLKTERR